MDWFRRIHAGRPTWKHRQQGTPKVTVWSAAEPDWTKKVGRLKRLQASSAAYGDDARFNYRNLPAQESSDRQEVLTGLDNVKKTNVEQHGIAIWDGISVMRRSNISDEHMVFALRLQFAGVGHMIGLHIRRNVAETGTIERNVKPQALHVFDPNIGEFEVETRCSTFLGELLKVYDGKLQYFYVARVKPWWIGEPSSFDDDGM